MIHAIVANTTFGKCVAISVVDAVARIAAIGVVIAIRADAVVVETVAVVRAQLTTAASAAHAACPGITA